MHLAWPKKSLIFLRAADTSGDTGPAISLTNEESGAAPSCRQWSSAGRAGMQWILWSGVWHLCPRLGRRAPAEQFGWGLSKAEAQTPCYLWFLLRVGPQGGLGSSASQKADLTKFCLYFICFSLCLAESTEWHIYTSSCLYPC